MTRESLERRPIRIAVMNDYQVVVQGLRKMLAPWWPRIEVVELEVSTPPLLGVDIALFDMFGQDRSSIPQIRRQLQDAGVAQMVVYAWNFTPQAARALLQSGISGVISKRLPADLVADALLQVAAGETVIVSPDWNTTSRDVSTREEALDPRADWPGREYGLTMREAEVIAMIALGLSNSQIAKRLFLSGNTVKSYIHAAYRKIGVTRRSQAVAWGLSHGLTPHTTRT